MPIIFKLTPVLREIRTTGVTPSHTIAISDVVEDDLAGRTVANSFSLADVVSDDLVGRTISEGFSLADGAEGTVFFELGHDVYALGGLESTPDTYLYSVDKYELTTDTRTAPAGSITSSSPRSRVGGMGGTTSGVVAGGWDEVELLTTALRDKYTYSTDTITNLSNLTFGFSDGDGVGNSDAGYFCQDTFQKHQYSDDTTTNSGSMVTQDRYTGNSTSTHGFLMGGREDLAASSAVRRFDFSTLTMNTTWSTGTSGSYYSGFNDGTSLHFVGSTVHKTVAIADGTVANATASPTSASRAQHGADDADAIITGGATVSSPNLSSTRKWNFAGSSWSVGTALAGVRSRGASISNGSANLS